MLYIRKASVPNDVQEKSIEIKKTAEWKKVFSSDSNAIRSYFDLLDKEKIREGLRKEQHALKEDRMKFHYCVLYTPVLKQQEVQQVLQDVLPEGRGIAF